MKQTAVEYLLEFCETANCRIPNDIIQQAKEMEKEQIMDVYWDGGQDIPTHQNTVEEYFEKTFNTKEI